MRKNNFYLLYYINYNNNYYYLKLLAKLRIFPYNSVNYSNDKSKI